jgi:hypothetical protein
MAFRPRLHGPCPQPRVFASPNRKKRAQILVESDDAMMGDVRPGKRIRSDKMPE